MKRAFAGTLALAIGLTGVAVASAAARPTRLASCDEAPGATIAQSGRWRIFWAAHFRFMDFGPEGRTLYACRRVPGAATRVRVLGYGDDPYLELNVRHIVGDIVQIDRRSRYRDYGELVDLRRGRRAPGDVAYSADGGEWPDGGNEAQLLPGGSVVSAPFGREIPDAPADLNVGGPLTLYGDRGPVRLASSARALAPSRGLDGRSSGAYYLDVNRRAARVSGAGRATGLPWTSDPSLSWRSHRFPVAVSRHRSALLTTTGSSAWIARRERGRGGARSSVQLIFDAFPSYGPSDEQRRTVPVAELAPGSEDDARVIATSIDQILVAGRFADASTESRLRLFSASDSTTQPRLDLPISALPEGDGKAAITRYGVVLADRDGLVWWRPTQGTGDLAVAAKLPAQGAGDLSIADRDPNILYYTDSTGPHVLRWEAASRPPTIDGACSGPVGLGPDLCS